MEEKTQYHAVFKCFDGDEYIMSAWPLTQKEIDRAVEMSRFSFDFSDFGLRDLNTNGQLIDAAYCFATLEEAEDFYHKMNNNKIAERK